ncbi:MAG: YjbQ family protein, partial [Anaerolineae bacterium]|nr:YjbQ family protein [Anaerolineae bacterium]
MKSYTKYLTFNTKRRRELIHITHEVEDAVRESGIKEGLAFVSAMHITAAVFV